MTKKRCTDCKHTRGIGFDFWCGEGHTEYEVFGAETNCPYYEYYDWSKGTPSRTEKRFTYLNTTGWNKDGFLNIMNGLNEKNKKLQKENEQLKRALKGYHNAFDCSQCRYHNYDWYDDGDEFEVCDKGNNEAQMEYHSCKDWEEL